VDPEKWKICSLSAVNYEAGLTFVTVEEIT